MNLLPAQLKITVPVVDPVDVRAIARVAAAVGGPTVEVQVVEVVEVTDGADASRRATAARYARTHLRELVGGLDSQARPVVKVASSIAQGVLDAAAESAADLVLVGRPATRRAGDPQRAESIARALLDDGTHHVAMLRLASTVPERIVVAVRGGPNADLALDLSRRLADGLRRPLVVVHIVPPGLPMLAREAAERALRATARAAGSDDPEVTVIDAPDAVVALRAFTLPGDMLVVGATLARAAEPLAHPMGSVPGALLDEGPTSIVVVRDRSNPSPEVISAIAAQPGSLPSVDRAIAELGALPRRVDHWFAEASYHHSEFGDLARLARQKERTGLSVSLVLPALNEEATIGPIVRAARTELVDRWGIVDELLVIDSASTDRTREIAAAEGARVVSHPDVLPGYGSYAGKGEALWKSLFETTGDIVAWADTDVRDWHPRMAYGTVGALLQEPRLQYVKGYYQRPILENGVLREGGGGRVTELVARPLINLLFPELSGFIQPLAGEYAGRRSVLERIPFFTGYGVEIGHLLDLLELVGLDGLGQVDLDRREHRNQDLEGLSKMSFVVVQAVLRRLEHRTGSAIFGELGATMKLPRSSANELLLEVIELGDRERPPIIDLPEYAGRRATQVAGSGAALLASMPVAEGLAAEPATVPVLS